MIVYRSNIRALWVIVRRYRADIISIIKHISIMESVIDVGLMSGHIIYRVNIKPTFIRPLRVYILSRVFLLSFVPCNSNDKKKMC